MKTMNPNLIAALATQFRRAISAVPKERLPISLRQFPAGACGDASLLLARYLNDNGCHSFEYVSGYWNDMSHAWLEKEGVIVDITADQFDSAAEAVIVTSDKNWHARFRGQKRRPATILSHDALATAYAAIIQKIPDA